MASGVSMLLALISVTIVTRLLAPEEYAVLAYIGVISGMVFTITASWTATALVRYGREELERDGTVRATSWGRITITAPLVVGAVLIVVGLQAIGALPTELTWALVSIALATGVVLIAGEHAVNLLEACGRMKLTATALVLQRAVAIAGLAALALWGSAVSPGSIALVWLAAGAVMAAGLIAIVWNVGVWPPSTDKTLLRRMMAFSLPMIAFTVSQYVIKSVDLVVLGAYRPTADVGLYAVAYQGYGMLQQLATTATIVLSPLFVSLMVASRGHVIDRYFARAVPQVMFLSAVVAGLGAPAATIVVPIVFGSAYQPASEPLQILLLAWVLFAAASFAAPIIVLHERSRAIATINGVAAIVNIVGDWLLIGVLDVGIAGPALATAASLLVIAIGYFRVAADCLHLTRSFPAGVLTPALCGVTISVLVPGTLGAVLSVAGTLALAATLLLVVRPFRAEDASMIGMLDIPAPIKQRLLRLLRGLG